MASIFDVPIEEVTREDVETFLASKLPEAERHEYKSEWESGKVGEAMCGFANTSGGMLLVGATDDKGTPPFTATGIDPHGRTSWEDQARSIASSMTPPLRIDVKSIDISDGRVVIIIRVSPSVARPHAYRDRVMIRLGHETKTASISIVEQLLRNREAIRAGQTRLAELKGSFPQYANAYRKVLIADTYAESAIFLDLESDMMVEAAAQAALGYPSTASPRPRAIHVARDEVPGGNDYVECDRNLSLVRYSCWLRNENANLDNKFMVSETASMLSSAMALSLRLRERFQRSLLIDIGFDQSVHSDIALADVHPWNHFLGLRGSEKAPSGPPIHEECSIDLGSQRDRLRVIADIGNLSARACGLAATKSFFETMAAQSWEKAIHTVDFAISNFQRSISARRS